MSWQLIGNMYSKQVRNFQCYCFGADKHQILRKKSQNLLDFIVRKIFIHFPKIEKEMRDLLNVNLFISRLFNQKQ